MRLSHPNSSEVSQYPDSEMFFGIYMNGIRGEPGMTMEDVRRFVHTERVAHLCVHQAVDLEVDRAHIVTLSKDLDGFRGATKYTYLGSNSLCGFCTGRGTDLPVWTENIPGSVTHMQAYYSGLSHAAGHEPPCADRPVLFVWNCSAGSKPCAENARNISGRQHNCNESCP